MLGGHAVAQCLRNEGVRHVFCVPGESHIAVLDGLCDMPEIKLITNRQEGCSCFMAEGMPNRLAQLACVWSPAVPAPPTPASPCIARSTIPHPWCSSSVRWG